MDHDFISNGGPVSSNPTTRRCLLRSAAGAAVGLAFAASAKAEEAKGTSVIEFEDKLAQMRDDFYRHPKIDILKDGFRPVGGKVADFAVAELNGRFHFYYIERRLQEGTPFYPGHEIYFGHASTPNFIDWEVHEPVMLVRPGTWEGAHVWAPSIIRRGDEFLMAYTGVNSHLSQSIGLASSTDLFNWKRWESNPIRPCKDRPWAYWREDSICSCRDPSLFEHDGKIWFNYTASTKEGASCIALCSSSDLKTWEDRGPILVGPTSGYEPTLQGGHKQGCLESACMVRRKGKWFLIIKASTRIKPWRQWIIPGERIDHFDFADGWNFWKEGICVEIVKDRGQQSLIAGMVNGNLKFAEVDWSAPKPEAHNIERKEQFTPWLA
jgi:predicted GH43/DUF377 family glycosyl hydrolase